TPAAGAATAGSRSPSRARNGAGAQQAPVAAAATSTRTTTPCRENDPSPPLTLPITQPTADGQDAEPRKSELPAPTGADGVRRRFEPSSSAGCPCVELKQERAGRSVHGDPRSRSGSSERAVGSSCQISGSAETCSATRVWTSNFSRCLR